MARYIDADKLTDMCKEIMADDWNKRTSPVSWADAYEGFIEDTDEQPTADVAPRAEVAREIFEEIERLLSANQSGEFRGDSIEWFDYFDLHLAEDIAELKKKYTGGDQ